MTICNVRGFHLGGFCLAIVWLLCTVEESNAVSVISIDSFQSGRLQPPIQGNRDISYVSDLDAAGSDKLVVVLGAEHNFINTNGNFNSVSLNGVSLTEAIQEGTEIPTVAIFYLDNPSTAGVGDLVVNASPLSGAMYSVYLLSGTAPGTGMVASDVDETVELAATAEGSLVIVGFDNAGPNGQSGAGDVDAIAPLIEDTPYLQVGNRWNSMASGHAFVAEPSTATYAWTIDDPLDLTATVAVEFRAAGAMVIPEPSSVVICGLALAGLLVARRRIDA